MVCLKKNGRSWHDLSINSKRKRRQKGRFWRKMQVCRLSHDKEFGLCSHSNGKPAGGFKQP